MPPTVPADPKIFHITHVSNLRSVIADGGLSSDSARVGGKFTATNIGHLHIKSRRLKRTVGVAAGGVLADYVPFNFCPRSVMLYVVAQGHDDYQGGDDDVVHLVSSVNTAVVHCPTWAFTDRHAELAYAAYYTDLNDLKQVPWHVMGQRYWSNVKEERQAEFLVHGFFPWDAISQIVVKSAACEGKVKAVLKAASHQPPVSVKPNWYY